MIILGLQVLSGLAQRYVSWDIIDPASNDWGWYSSSLQHVALSWIWPAAWIAWWGTRDYARAAVMMAVMVVVAKGGPEVPWEGMLTQEERVLRGLTWWYQALAKDMVQTGMALAAVRWPWLLAPLVGVAALRVFL